MSTSIAENKQLITSYLNDLSGKSKPLDIIRKYVDDPALIQHILEVEAAFPRYEIAIQEIIGERDLVVVRGIFRGVQQGVFAGREPAGKSAAAALMIIYRVAENRIVEHWLQFDLFGLLQQLKQETLATAI